MAGQRGAGSARSIDLSYGALGAVLVLAAAAVIGTKSLGDNSFLTHLSTGRYILEEGRVPTRDLYSFTAPDAAWVVQSWLASVVYAAVEWIGGGLGLRLLHTSLTVATTAFLWRLSRPADAILARLGLVALALVVGSEEWAERPFMFGGVFFGLYVLACYRAVPGPLLAAAGWVWVNTHGSYPLGLVVVATFAIGRWLDGERPTLELKALRWAAFGMLAAAVNPLGPKLLIFPIHLLQRQEILRNVIEWQAPSFVEAGDRAFLVLLVVAIVALVRSPSWRSTIPLLAFAVAALLGTRNLVFASIVLVAVSGPGLSDVGSLRTGTTIRYGAVIAGVVGVLAGAVLISRFQEPHFAIASRYPTRALGLLEQKGVDLQERRLVSLDSVGNLLTSVYPHDRVVYFDDRFDMYPEEISRGNITLLRGEAGWRTELESVAADIVIWDRSLPLSQLLIESQGWSTALVDDRWAMFCRSDSVPELGC